MSDSHSAEIERRALESKKFSDLATAVKIYVAKFGSPYARRSGHIQRLAYEDPGSAIEHIEQGANLPADLTYESQLSLATSFLEEMFDEPFNVEALLQEGMPPENTEPLAPDIQTLLDKYIALNERLEKILRVYKTEIKKRQELNTRIWPINHAIGKAIEKIYDRESPDPSHSVENITAHIDIIEAELK